MDDADSRVKEWAELYASLTETLLKYGRIDAFGEGDFCLVDDDYGSAQHKVECREAAITPALVADVQALLSAYARRWQIIFAVPANEGREHAFLVYADSMSEHEGAPGLTPSVAAPD